MDRAADAVPPDLHRFVADPAAKVRAQGGAPNPALPLPGELFAPERRTTSLGRTHWSAAPASTVDPSLSAVLLDNITARLAVIDREQRYRYANREMLERAVAELEGAEAGVATASAGAGG